MMEFVPGPLDFLQYWVAAFLTLCVYSFLWRDNIFYKFGEALFVGTSVGYTLGVFYKTIAYTRLIFPLVFLHKYYYLFACLLGAMYLTRLSRKHGWLSRYPIAMLIGFSSGMAIPYAIQAQIFKQVGASMLPLWSNSGIEINNILIVVGVLCTLFYFFFSIEHKGRAIRIPVRIGIVYIMIAFGATFGYTVMARFSLLIGRINFLWYTWLGSMFGFQA